MTSAPLRHRLRRIRRWAGYLVAIGLIAVALVVGATSQLLPLAERHPERVAAWLSEKAGRPVALDQVRTRWTRRGPLLQLDGLRIGGGPGADAGGVSVGQAEVLVSLYAGLLPGRSFTELRLRGLELALERDADGRWQVRGLPGQAQSQGDPFEALEGLGELQVIDGVLVVDAPGLGLDARLHEVDLRLRVDGGRVRAAARAWMVPDVSPIDITAELDRDSGDARAWLALREADLSAWTALRAGGIAALAGRGRVEAWAELRAHRVQAVNVRGTLDGLRLQGGAAPALHDVDIGKVALDARWALVDGGWRLDARRLRLGAGEDAQDLDGLLVAGGQRRALVASRVDAGALLALAPLAPDLPASLANWLREARPGGLLRDVRVVGEAGGPLQVSAALDGLGFGVIGQAPGLSGLSGRLQGDAAGLVFTPDPAATVVVDWPAGFGPPAHEVRLRGELALWRDAGGWQLQAPALRIDGEGYGVAVRGGLAFPGDGTRPAIDLAAEVDEARVPVAKRFWIRHLMPGQALHWLDTALVDGRVLDGRAVVSGDLDDWPFSAGTNGAGAGLFHASARLEDAEVRFDPDWPAANALDGRIDFIAAGFSLEGRGRVGEVPVESLRAGIADFGDAPLRVDAVLAADAEPVLALLRTSPLRKGREEVLDALEAAGPLRASFGLVLPLGGGDGPGPRVRGRVALAGARLAETRWDVAFEDVHGEARYDETGFAAQGLRVRQDGRPGLLSLRAGDAHVATRGMAFEAELEASLPASELAARAPQLAWLGKRLEGRSDWTLALGLPDNAGDDGSGGRLQLRSNLVGTRLTLPEPLGKPASEALPARIDLRLPMGEGDVDVVLGERVALRTRNTGGRTGVLAVLGRDRVDAMPPASGIRVTGRTPVLDAIEWVGMFGGDDAADGDGLELRGIDLAADRLQLLGGVFPSTRVVARPGRGGTQVRLDGEAIAGTLSIPRGEGATVAAELQRLHWRSARAGAGAASPPDASAAGNGDIDPAAIPPLAVVIEDLRVADAQLGRLELRTHPGGGGLQVEMLQVRAPRQAVDVQGAWTGRGDAARTRMQVAVDSRDFGALLSGFGFGARLKGGHGTARFDAAWPGTPAGFRLGELEGSLALDVEEGQLVEVEPGAGRFLGLLSVAELPRRLMLDFRDFFSRGFAFNRIDGTVRFRDGKASSESLVIDGAAAEIHIGGSADLRAQTYDQVIEVQPRTGGLLTAVGALTAGPVGAAVGAVANAMFEKPLGRMGARTYHVTGPWKDPRVEVEGRDTELQPETPPTPVPAE